MFQQQGRTAAPAQKELPADKPRLPAVPQNAKPHLDPAVQLQSLREITAASHPQAPIADLKGAMQKLAARFEQGERSPELTRLLAAGFAACTERFGDEIQPEAIRCFKMLHAADRSGSPELTALKFNFLGIIKDKREILEASGSGADQAAEQQILSRILRAEAIVQTAGDDTADPELKQDAIANAITTELKSIETVLNNPQSDAHKRADAVVRLSAMYYQSYGSQRCEEQYLSTCKIALSSMAGSNSPAQDPREAFAQGHLVWNELTPQEYQTILSAKPEHSLAVFSLMLTALKDPKADLSAIKTLPAGATPELRAVFEAKRNSLGITE